MQDEIEYPPAVELTPAVHDWLLIYDEAKRAIAVHEEKAKNARAKIEEALGESEGGTFNGVLVVRFTHVSTERIDTKTLKTVIPAEVLAPFTSVTLSRRLTLVEPD